MTYDKKYSLGIYVNDWGFMMGSEGNPHVFLGLKIEKVKCNDMQINMQEDLYRHYLKYNMLEQANQCKIEILLPNIHPLLYSMPCINVRILCLWILRITQA